jgi:hypothetical protein
LCGGCVGGAICRVVWGMVVGHIGYAAAPGSVPITHGPYRALWGGRYGPYSIYRAVRVVRYGHIRLWTRGILYEWVVYRVVGGV